jgi:predicted N-acetyltransferase YhbS
MTKVRSYQDSDYPQLKALYENGDLYGGQFDPARDARERLQDIIAKDAEAILVYEDNNEIMGTISLIDDGRVAWLFRFAVAHGAQEKTVAKELYQTACDIFARRGHTQVLVYSPVGHVNLDARYHELLGMNKGNAYTCYWTELKK